MATLALYECRRTWGTREQDQTVVFRATCCCLHQPGLRSIPKHVELRRSARQASFVVLVVFDVPLGPPRFILLFFNPKALERIGKVGEHNTHVEVWLPFFPHRV